MENCCLTNVTNIYDWWIVLTICGSVVILAIIFAIVFRCRVAKERQMITTASEQLKEVIKDIINDQNTCVNNAQILTGEADRLKKTCENLDEIRKKLEESLDPQNDAKKSIKK